MSEIVDKAAEIAAQEDANEEEGGDVNPEVKDHCGSKFMAYSYFHFH